MLSELRVFDDLEPHSAALNMAIDEVLLESARVPSLRFYRWRSASVSFGYFGRLADAQTEFPGSELVRRWTGGGIVAHGADLTYSVVLPHPHADRFRSSRVAYSLIHGAIIRALGADSHVTLASTAAPKISDACFANAVENDVIANGRKIAGAAQRRTRGGLLHQGSIQAETIPAGFRERFAGELCAWSAPDSLGDELLTRASEIAAAKYATNEWLQRR